VTNISSVPTRTRWAIVGGGFAGAATAWALGELGAGGGVIIEQETSCGTHASGRNAAIARLFESDAVIGSLVRRSVARIRGLRTAEGALIRPTGGVTLASPQSAGAFAAEHALLQGFGHDVQLLSPREARQRFPFLETADFGVALWCGDDGVVDIHALLGLYLSHARKAGFTVLTSCRAEELLVESGRVVGVRTAKGVIRADIVIDAGGPWAGRVLAPLPLRPLQRHLFVSGPSDRIPVSAPVVWNEDAGLYFRPDSGGVLLSPCDETPADPGTPAVDPAATELLAEKVARFTPGLADLPIRRSWACLRTFAPDRRPLIGADPRLPGLFHVSGLGGIGMQCSAAIGELAAALLLERSLDWIEAAALAPARLALGDNGESAKSDKNNQTAVRPETT
jgi:D-arginine dehydrogenase